MKKILSIIVLLSLLTVMVFTASGCARAAQRTMANIIEKQLEDAGVNLNTNDDGYTMEVTDESGTAEINVGSTKLPDGFPDQVPVYSNMEITMANSVKSGDKVEFMVWGTSKDDSEKIFEWQKDKLSSWNSYTETSWSANDSKGYAISASMGEEGDSYSFTLDVQIMQEKDEVIIMYMVLEQ